MFKYFKLRHASCGVRDTNFTSDTENVRLGDFSYTWNEPGACTGVIDSYDACEFTDTTGITSKITRRCDAVGITTPRVLHVGGAISIEAILKVLEPSGHGAIDAVEGAVWRVERNGAVDFLGKYVRHEKEDGKYLNGVDGIVREPIYNWHPNQT